MTQLLPKEKYKILANQALKKGLRICGNITRLGQHSGITSQTLTSIARGKSCSHATRLKLEAFIEEFEKLINHSNKNIK
ncbi:hypothetical protein [Silvanigrella sp.]|jgi:hypothetical protein|uniref:hypothetical protein n=1 Tax=Silvanigrella sp. TaxID=2024976 RepID=UPI0037C838E9|nr:hypothetical protein [Silvanigrellaceae bacterium]